MKVRVTGFQTKTHEEQMRMLLLGEDLREVAARAGYSCGMLSVLADAIEFETAEPRHGRVERPRDAR